MIIYSMAPPRGKTWIAMLGFLSWKPMSGYDIKKLVDVSLVYFWTVSYGQIYPLLKKLVANGLATVEEGEGRGRRVRDQYRITPAGQSALDDWMKQPIDLSVQRDEMQLKLFLGGQHDLGQTITLIEGFREQQVARHRVLEAEYAEMEPCVKAGILPEEHRWLEPHGLGHAERLQAVQEQSLIFLLSIRQGILKAEARITWADEATALLTKMIEHHA